MQYAENILGTITPLVKLNRVIEVGCISTCKVETLIPVIL
jgi:hypothetical protein